MSDHLIKGYYVAIPEKTLDSEAWRSLTPSTRCVYTAMLLRYKRTGSGSNDRVKWKQPELAEKSGLSLRTVRTCLHELQEKGWIEVWEPGGRRFDGTTYIINPIYADRQTPKPT